MSEDNKKQKMVDVTKADLIKYIAERTLTFEEAQAICSDNTHHFIDDVPLWLYACRRGCPEFYFAHLCVLANTIADIGEFDLDVGVLACLDLQKGIERTTSEGIPIETIAVKGGEDDADLFLELLGKKKISQALRFE